MRIVGGDLKGRRIETPRGPDIRPTSDRVREAVFNVLDHAPWAVDLHGASVVDVFAGTGAMGFEAISRKAASATFVEKDRGALDRIKALAAKFGVWRDVCLLNVDATHLAPPPPKAQAPCQIAFVDPPYGEGLVAPAIFGLRDKGWVTGGSLIVAEMGKGESLEPLRGITTRNSRTHGAARVDFLIVN